MICTTKGLVVPATHSSDKQGAAIRCLQAFQQRRMLAMDEPLIAVSLLMSADHEVGFGKGGVTVTNKASGKETRFHKKNNVYAMRIWVKRRSS